VRRALLIAAFTSLVLAGWVTLAPALGPTTALSEYGEGNAYVIFQYGSHRIALIPKGAPVPYGWYIASEVALSARQSRGLRSVGLYRLR
jgi:hypothetical protein